jgi:hypothetical protein
MNEVYIIKAIYNKSESEFFQFAFETEKQAKKHVKAFSSSLQEKLVIIKMNANEFLARLAMQIHYNNEEIEAIQNEIQKRDDKDFIYEQLSLCSSEESEFFITEQYCNYLRFEILEGYDEIDSVKEYLDYLRQKINEFEKEEKQLINNFGKKLFKLFTGEAQ